MIEYKLIYSSLTNLDHHIQNLYNKHQLIKLQCQSIVNKNGFISRPELQKVADHNKQSRISLIRNLDNLNKNGFIQKSKYGYTLTSNQIIFNNLKLKTKNKENGKEELLFKKVQLPDDLKAIELTRMYFLINQIYGQYQFRKSNVNKTDKRTRPERFELSLFKIKLKGKYNNEMQVLRLINSLESVNLLTAIRGKLNSSGKNDCNQYTLLPFHKAKWNKIDEKRLTYKEQMRLISDQDHLWNKKKKVSTEKSKKEKKIITYSESELKFYKCLDAGLQDILVDKGILSRKTYHSFGSKKGRKVSKSMLSNLIIHSLNDSQLRSIMMTIIKPENIKVEDCVGMSYDGRLATYCYDRYSKYCYHKLSLVDADGNFNEYNDELLLPKNRQIGISLI